MSARVEPLTGLPGGEGRGLMSFMALLLAAAGLVLFIAGVNVASMLSARHLLAARWMSASTASMWPWSGSSPSHGAMTKRRRVRYTRGSSSRWRRCRA